MVNNRRGAALFFVLLITAVVAALMSAFIGLQRQQMGLTADTASRQMAYQACLSGLNWAQGQLENNSGWGNASFPAGDTRLTYGSVMNVTLHGNGATGEPDPEQNWADGEIHPPGGLPTSFRVRLCNNLETADAVTTGPLGPLPGRSVRLRVEGTSGRTHRRLDAVMRRRAFTNSSTQTELDLRVEADTLGWTLESRDPVNMIRANGDIHAPDPLGEPNLFRFAKVRGVAKAAGDILIPQSLRDPANAALKAQAESAAKANGRLQPQSAPVVVPELKREQLKLPTETFTLASGSYRTGTCTQSSWQEFQDVVDPTTTPPTTQTRYRKCALVLPTLITPDGRVTAYKDPNGAVPGPVYPLEVQDTPGSSNWDQTPDEFNQTGMVELATVQVDDDGDPDTPKVEKHASFDIPGRVLSLPPGATAEVNGDLNLGTNRFDGTAIGANITLLMGFDMEATRNSSSEPYQRRTQFAVGGMARYAALNQMEGKGAALVTAGNVHVTGSTYGLGSISAEKNLHFSAPTGLVSTPNVGLAVRGGESIDMAPPPAMRSNSVLLVDGPVFDKAMDGADPSYASLAQIVGMAPEQRKTLGESVGSQEARNGDGTALSPVEAWNRMKAELGNKPTPDFSSSPYNQLMGDGKFSVQEYIQLRETFRTGREDWLTDLSYIDQAKQLLVNQLVLYQNWAAEKDAPGAAALQEFMNHGALIPEMYFRGLVYAGRDGVTVNANRNAFYNEGALVSKGSINILDSPGVSSIYNRAFLEDIVKENSVHQVRLETIFFNLQ